MDRSWILSNVGMTLVFEKAGLPPRPATRKEKALVAAMFLCSGACFGKGVWQSLVICILFLCIHSVLSLSD